MQGEFAPHISPMAQGFLDQAALIRKCLSRQIVRLHIIFLHLLFWNAKPSHTNTHLGILEVGFEDEVGDVSQEDDKTTNGLLVDETNH